MPELSVVIVCYRTPELLRSCLEHLTGQQTRRSLQIVVVDNDSGDESPEVARGFPGVQVVETGKNLGYAGGVNRGLAAAAGRFIMVMNPDVEFRPGALDALADFMEAHPETGIAAPKLMNPDGTLQHSCRRHYTMKTVLLRRTFLGRLFPGAPELRRHLMLDYDHATARAVDWVAGAAMMVRREALADVGPMDERYFLYFEDVDWCTRMQARGWLVHYVPESIAVHRWQRASRVLGSAARRHLRSGLRFYDRWGGLLYVLRQNRGALRIAALVITDLVAVALALILAYLFRQQLAFVLQKPLWSLGYYRGFFSAAVLVYLFSFSLLGLYREVKEGDWVDVVFRVSKAATLGALFMMASTFILDMRSYSRIIVLGSWPLVVTLAFLGRRFWFAAFTRARRDRWTLRRVALVGEDPLLDRVESVMRENPELGWDPVRIRRLSWRGHPPAESEKMMVQRLAGERVSDVVVSPVSMEVSEEALAVEVLPWRRAGLGVRLVSSFLTALPSRARLEIMGGVPWLSLERPSLRVPNLSKRLLDLVLTGLLLLVGGLPFLAVLLARTLGRRGVWEPEEVWRGRWGASHPVRRLAAGGWLRGYPLLGQVLAGRFSLVGPRPLVPGEEIPGGDAWRRVRENHRPGLVGPWSLSPAPSPEEEMQQELRYLEEWSPELDLKLLTRVALNRPRGGSGRGTASPAARADENREATPAAAPQEARFMGMAT